MAHFYLFAFIHIRQCTRHTQYLMVRAGSQIQFVIHLFHVNFLFFVKFTIFKNPRRRDMTVKAKIFSPIPHFLYFLRAHNTCSDFFGFFTFSGIVKIPKSDLWNFHTNVDPVQKRPADLPQIPVNRSRCTGTSLHVRIIPAFAGIHCCHKHKISRIFITCIQPCYTDFFLLHRLS